MDSAKYEMSFLDQELLLFRELFSEYIVQAHKTSAKIENEVKRRRKRRTQNMKINGMTSKEISSYFKEQEEAYMFNLKGGNRAVPW
jgi:thermostable 8-oxoguanine DNA glycosylase